MASKKNSRKSKDLPIILHLSSGQAGIMAFFGVGLIVGAGLLTFVLFDANVPMFWKTVVALLSLYLAWTGVTYIQGALNWRKSPVFSLTEEGVVSHEDLEPVTLPWGDIQEIAVTEKRGVERTVIIGPPVDDSEGAARLRIEIPATVENYERAVAYLDRFKGNDTENAEGPRLEP